MDIEWGGGFGGTNLENSRGFGHRRSLWVRAVAYAGLVNQQRQKDTVTAHTGTRVGLAGLKEKLWEECGG